jgi:hypothetical protein
MYSQREQGEHIRYASDTCGDLSGNDTFTLIVLRSILQKSLPYLEGTEALRDVNEFVEVSFRVAIVD